jgi:hypothetical protein
LGSDSKNYRWQTVRNKKTNCNQYSTTCSLTFGFWILEFGISILFPLYLPPLGDVAQLARAFGWQPKGRGFEPHLLHLLPRKVNIYGVLFF